MKLATRTLADEERASVLARRYINDCTAVMATAEATPARERCERKLEITCRLLAHFAALDYLPSARAELDGALDAWLARDGAERTRRESVAPPVAHDEPWECVINCVSRLHCEGCGEHSETTRDRIGHLDGPVSAVAVRYCDDCAVNANTGQDERFDRVTDVPTVADATGVSR